MFPGFIDPHHHTVLAALMAHLFIDVGYGAYRSRADALSALKATAAKQPSGQWVRAACYDNLLQGGDLSMSGPRRRLDRASGFRLVREWTCRRC